ncbi:hypothetical protein [Lysobacter niastensis]|uniref:Glycosyltransferase RgtA/B/C/D-like domain-containing protein n=1 Tax=Lysobacter niastensis TaxID=380629 RepID=A0ABS0BE60_9GAMM|nr:hypothetical protein [Lysobacter niastensis]MBF6025977.1 hypothetical protein [Lysobacter niastensis]
MSSASQYTPSALRHYVRENPLLIAFAVLAVVLRIAHWAYTGRIWEDALITLTPAENFWDGMGFTHHPSEPRVHSFTSPISVLIPLVGVLFGNGLLALRLTALAGSVAAIYFAYSIGRKLEFGKPAQVLLLGYLAVDQLQIFFGMSGMETQVVTAILLAGVYFLFAERWIALGVACGLALLSRPEFQAFVALVGLWLLIFRRDALVRVIAAALAIVLPWAIFAISYFGSIVPNTIRAKTWGGRISLFDHTIDAMTQYFLESWKHMAPFLEWSITNTAPVPRALIVAVTLTVLALAVIGMILVLARRNTKMMVVVATVLVFIGYKTVATLNPYYMWYLPPFIALLFLIAAFGLNAIQGRAQKVAAALAAALVLAYGIHVPYTFYTDRIVQDEIEIAVRQRVGKRLNELMGPNDSVFLEPLGYMGYEIRGKTTYDFPGLSSPKVVEVIRNLPEVRMGGVIDRLKPSYAVLRPQELDEFQRYFPETFSHYREVDRITAKPLFIERWGYSVYAVDTDFTIRKYTP